MFEFIAGAVAGGAGVALAVLFIAAAFIDAGEQLASAARDIAPPLALTRPAASRGDVQRSSSNAWTDEHKEARTESRRESPKASGERRRHVAQNGEQEITRD